MAKGDSTAIRVTLDQIRFLEAQPRPLEEYEEDHPHMRSMIASIKADGILQAPLAIPDTKRGEGFYVIVGGRSRATAALVYLKMPDILVTLREDLNEAGAKRAAFAENFMRNEVNAVANAMYLHDIKVEEGEAAVMKIKGAKPSTLKIYLKIGELLSRLSDDQRNAVKKKCTSFRQLRALEGVSPAEDNAILWDRIRHALGMTRAGKQAIEAKKPDARTITINGQAAEISIKPRTTTIHIKCGADAGQEIADLLDGFMAGQQMATEAPRRNWLARLLGR